MNTEKVKCLLLQDLVPYNQIKKPNEPTKQTNKLTNEQRKNQALQSPVSTSYRMPTSILVTIY